MAVYVDTLRDYGWRLGKSCHMWADTLEELHAMAARIGMKRSWFQNDYSLPHYDLVKSRRDLALQFGAVEAPDHVMVRQMKVNTVAACERQIAAGASGERLKKLLEIKANNEERIRELDARYGRPDDPQTGDH